MAIALENIKVTFIIIITIIIGIPIALILIPLVIIGYIMYCITGGEEDVNKNIFENSYFGKPYRTRDNKKALLLGVYENSACLAIEDGTLESHYSLDGTLPYNKEYEIISEW